MHELLFKLQVLLIKIGVPVCHGFDHPCFNMGYRQRQNTAYEDDEKNYVHLCEECAKQNDEHWDDMWSDYYGSRL